MRRPALVLTLLVVLLLAVRPAASAQEPTLEFTPAFGSCEQPMVVVGRGFPPDAAVEVGVPGMTEFASLVTVTADADGRFRVELPSTFPEACHPGSLLGVAAVAESAAGRTSRVAEYEVASPWRLEIVSCRGRGEMHVRGEGFPANQEVDLSSGDNNFAAHSFAHIARLTTNSIGAFDEQVTSPGCPADLRGIQASLATPLKGEGDPPPPGYVNWRARANSTVPSPASTGHGVEGQRSTLPLELVVGAITVVLLLGGRGASRFR